MRRSLASGVGLAAVVFCATASVAQAKYLGSDPLGNMGPDWVLGGLADKYPLGRYGLDFHVKLGLGGGAPETMGQQAMQWTWAVLSYCLMLMIQVVAWATGVDYINGPNGIMPALDRQMTYFHEHVITEDWLATAVICAGCWGAWQSAKGRDSQMLGGLATSFVCMIICLWFIYYPAQTYGAALRMSHDLSSGVLSSLEPGSTPQEGRRAATDAMFKALIYRPWIAMQFGGPEHCVDRDRSQQGGYPIPVKCSDSRADARRNHEREVNGVGGYADRFLAHAVGTPEREAEYRALRDGKVPEVEDPQIDDCPRGDCSGTDDERLTQAQLVAQFEGYRISKVDSPAVDSMQEGGTRDRMVLFFLFLFQSLGAMFLLGPVVAILLVAGLIGAVSFGFAPLMLLFGMFPPTQHLFRAWLVLTASVTFIGIAFAILFVLVFGMVLAIGALGPIIGYGLVVFITGAFFWIAFVGRKLLGGRHARRLENRMSQQTKRTYSTASDVVNHPYKMTKDRVRKALRDDHHDREGRVRSGDRASIGQHEGRRRPEPSRDEPGRYTTVEDALRVPSPAPASASKAPEASPGLSAARLDPHAVHAPASEPVRGPRNEKEGEPVKSFAEDLHEQRAERGPERTAERAPEPIDSAYHAAPPRSFADALHAAREQHERSPRELHEEAMARVRRRPE